MVKNRLNKRKSGFIIALAWPETLCKQAGGWYESITRLLGINKYGYYRVGHAALVLVDGSSGQGHYFDFGRYHAPYQHGRVRSAITDDDLKIYARAVFNEAGDQIDNMSSILDELQRNEACHGEGILFASCLSIDYGAALKEALNMQKANPHAYGPFTQPGSNCSRFVNHIIRSGRPDFWTWIKLRILVPLTPTPMNNVNALRHKQSVWPLRVSQMTPNAAEFDQVNLKSTIPMPVKPSQLNGSSHWLSGEGAGSWFQVIPNGSSTEIRRYSPTGELECSSLMEKLPKTWSSRMSDLSVTYPSDCSQVTLTDKISTIQLIRIAR